MMAKRHEMFSIPCHITPQCPNSALLHFVKGVTARRIEVDHQLPHQKYRICRRSKQHVACGFPRWPSHACNWLISGLKTQNSSVSVVTNYFASSVVHRSNWYPLHMRPRLK